MELRLKCNRKYWHRNDYDPTITSNKYYSIRTIKMNRTLPEKIVCTVKQNGNPVRSIFLKAIFETDYKNDYASILGPSDEYGKAELNRQIILHDAAITMELGLQDFGPIEKCFTGKIFVHIMDEKELGAALDAYELFKDVVDYPSGYKQKIENSIEMLKGVDKHSLEIDAYIIPETIKLSIE
jgi:hypothetical protein